MRQNISSGNSSEFASGFAVEAARAVAAVLDAEGADANVDAAACGACALTAEAAGSEVGSSIGRRSRWTVMRTAYRSDSAVREIRHFFREVSPHGASDRGRSSATVSE
jgi:hypothetical protein